MLLAKDQKMKQNDMRRWYKYQKRMNEHNVVCVFLQTGVYCRLGGLEGIPCDISAPGTQIFLYCCILLITKIFYFAKDTLALTHIKLFDVLFFTTENETSVHGNEQLSYFEPFV